MNDDHMPSADTSDPTSAAVAHGGPLPQRSRCALLSGLLLNAASSSQGGVVHVRPDGTQQAQSYAELLEQAQRILGGLRHLGLQPQDRVLLQLERSDDFLAGFWACVLGGLVPIPLALPPSYEFSGTQVQKLRNVYEAFEVSLVLCGASAIDGVRSLPGVLNCPPLRTALIDEARTAARDGRIHAADPEALALLLLTSGSTGLPKGVMLNSRNILSMLSGTIQQCGFTGEDVVLNWMPLDHVGALICMSMVALDLGAKQVLAPTGHVLQEPLRWLDLISQHRASISWVPNFAFSLINDRAGEIERRRWDLSSMRFLVNAGETVVARTVRAFLRLLGRHGLPDDAVRPAFGMSETCSGISFSDGFSLRTSADDMLFVDLGAPIPGASMRVVDAAGQIVKQGEIGRLQVRGPSVTSGYYRNPELNRELFDAEGWFTTGDLAFLRNGRLTLTGREKDTIIVNGINYYSHEIEAVVEELPGIEPSFTAACGVRGEGRNTDSLAIFFHTAEDAPEAWLELIRTIRGHVVRQVGINPEYLIPVPKEAIPKTGIGKIQRLELRQRFEDGHFAEILGQLAAAGQAGADIRSQPLSEVEQRVAELWRRVLGVEQVGLRENFFELGGHSLLMAQLHARLQEAFGRQLSIVELFRYPTVESLARYLSDAGPGESSPRQGQARAQRREARKAAGNRDIAVIGMACRFPGADGPAAFWRNLRDGVESIATFTEEEVLAVGIPPELARNPAYVKAGPILADVERFDAEFFGFSAREAALLDPQQRLFLECCHEAFEDAGYDPRTYPEAVGVYAGAGMNTYLLNHLQRSAEWLDPAAGAAPMTLDSIGGFQIMITNDKDYLPTRVSYKLNLRGPSLNIQTACSTTLVTVHMACQALLSGECEMALAGGVSVKLPQKSGHLFEENLLVSPDGHCRTFDARARGTIFGNGAGVLLLKRKAEAIADGDHIYAVIKGTAINNDGGAKMGYTAPGEDSQATVASEALSVAGVDADSIGFVEAHGTGTELGDPIEVGALTQAFRASSSRTGFCAIGSVKTNVGHLQIASGVAGIMKAILALQHRQIPPTLHFEQPNPRIDFANSPFFVNRTLLDWDSADTPRRAGVNSLGIGGTNAHVILEEAPARPPADNPLERPLHLLALSARTEAALRQLADRYAAFFSNPLRDSLADICFTAGAGRPHWEHRLAVVAADGESLRKTLKAIAAGGASAPPQAVFGSSAGRTRPKIAFLFPGSGAQSSGVGRELYETQPTFRRVIDRCDEALRPWLEQPLREWLVHGESGVLESEREAHAAAACFALGCALVELWRAWGVVPDLLMGQGAGEYAAAYAAGVFALEDGCRLLAAQAGLMGPSTPEGGQATASEEKAALIGQLARSIAFATPNRPLVASLSGQIAGPELAAADYWIRHALEPAAIRRQMEALERAAADIHLVLGADSERLERRLPAAGSAWHPSLAPGRSDWQSLLEALAAVYARGAAIDWAGFDRDYRRHRVSLPTYPFQRQRHWIEPAPAGIRMARAPRPDAHPLLGERLEMALRRPEILFEARLGDAPSAYLRQHRVLGRSIVPAAAYLEMVLSAGRAVMGTEHLVLEDVLFLQPLFMPEDGGVTVQTLLLPRGQDAYGFEIYARSASPAEAAWTPHASGVLRKGDAWQPPQDRLETIQARCPETLPAAEGYSRIAAQGLDYGPAFQTLDRLFSGKEEMLGRVCLCADASGGAAPYVIHPALLDGCLQVFLAALLNRGGEPLCLPFSIERLELAGRPTGALWSHVADGGGAGLSRRMRVALYGEDGAALASLEGLARPLAGQPQRGADRAVAESTPERAGLPPLHIPAWAPLPGLPGAAKPGADALLVARSLLPPLGEACARRLREQGASVRICTLETLPGELLGARRPQQVVYFAATPPGAAMIEAAEQQALAGLRLAQSLLAGFAAPGRLAWVTERAQAVFPGENPSLDQATLWGLGRVFMSEHPDWSMTLIDAEGSPAEAEALLAEVLAGAGEPQIALRGGQRYGARLADAGTAGEAPPPSEGMAGPVLITGGLGELGLAVARHLVRRWGVRHLLLLGRQAPREGAEATLASLREAGARVDVAQADVADRDALARVFAQLDAPPRGIVHAAGILDDGVITQQNPARFSSVLAPKLAGAWHLHELTQANPPDFFVLFSSVAALLGPPGQSNYASANAFLDALAHHRRALGLPCVSINWGPWAGGGMAARLEAGAKTRLRRLGLKFLGSDAALAGFDRALAQGAAQIGVFDLDLNQEQSEPESAPGRQRVAAPAFGANDGGWGERLAESSPLELQRELREWVRSEAVRVIGLPSGASLPLDRPLSDLGLDSLTAIELRNALAARLGRPLPATLVFDHPHVEALAHYLAELLKRDDPRKRPPEAPDIDGMSEGELDELLTMLTAEK